MGIIHRIIRRAVAFILVVNIGIFGFMAWPSGYSAYELANSGVPVVARAAHDAITQGEIYELDKTKSTVQAIFRLDIQLYSQMHNRLVTITPGWRAFVITGDLAREIEAKTNALAFTDSLNRVVIFLAVSGANPWETIAHEYTHVLQMEDNGRVLVIPRIVAEYEAEVTSRVVTSLLSDFVLPAEYPVHEISKLEKLEVLKYLAIMVQ